MSTPIDVSDSTFEKEVLQSDKLVLVDFWAEWCGPCRAIAPVLKEIAAEQEDRLKVAKVNIDENQQYAAQFGITSIPTMMLFKDGQKVDQIVGALPKRSITDRIEQQAEQTATA
ncbi:MAG TPA: thioredoxin [Thermomicrobiales bacterium]|nr:thioredoxin [Thermomicrobiales bacterium]